MMNKLDQSLFICIVLLVMVLPVSIAGVSIFASLAAVLFLVKRIFAVRSGGRFFGSIPDSVVISALAFFSICALSICFSEAPDLGIKALVAKIFQGIFLLFAVVDVVTTRRRVLCLFAAFGAAALLICVDGFWQLGRGVDFLSGNILNHGRVASAMKHPNDLGAYLIFPVIVSLGILLWAWFEGGERSDFVRKIGMAAVLLFGVSLSIFGLTYSRGSWLGALVAVIVFVLTRKKYLWACLGFVLVFALFFSPRMAETRNVSFISDSAAQFQGLSFDKFSGSDRLNMWKDASHIIKDHPVLGTGLNTYTRVIRRYSEFRKLYAHNGYIQLTAELGFVGLAAFLWLLFSIGNTAFRNIILLKDPMALALMAGLFAAWIGFLVQSGLDTTFYSVQLSRLLWFVMGFLVAGSMVMGKDSKSC